jgi:hypothetical protein
MSETNHKEVNHMKTIAAIILLAMCATTFLPAVVKNPDKPLKGTWDFKPQKAWEINQAGDTVLARPWQILVAGNGNVYVYDSKRRLNYLFDKDGKYIKTFAKRGEGPGEVRMQGIASLADNKIIIPDVNRVHYFSLTGDYITSSKINHSVPVSQFINEDEFISAPISFFQAIDNKWLISLCSVKTGEKKVLAQFDPFKGGIGKSNKGDLYDIIAPGLSPVMVAGYHEGRLLYGKSDQYEITIMGLDGSTQNTFTLEREKRKISAKAKRKRYVDNKSSMPIEVKKQIHDSLPDEIGCFHRIEVRQGLIYVFVTDLEHWKEGKQEPKQLDIFSMAGRYLYRCLIDFGDDGNLLNSPFPNMIFKDGFLYAALEDEESDIKIVKYKIAAPGI